ncbi:unnamed protein product [Knipowitschia caucasica]|uniref:Uncharacterized protein n=1 Tax=Knipowitschia caucasica TaxID=637954 RepID=A0AAV2M2W0_KNICA
METSSESPNKASEFLQELNRIIEAQRDMLEQQQRRIEELELQVAQLCADNASLQEQHRRHMATCRLQGTHPGGHLGGHPGGHTSLHASLRAVSDTAMSDV